MRKWIFNLSLLFQTILFSLLLPTQVFASLFVPQIIQQVNTTNGATDGVINGMVTDRFGRLWLATGEGLFIYDGKSAKKIGEEHVDMNGHSANSVAVYNDVVWSAGSFGLISIPISSMELTFHKHVKGNSYEAIYIKDDEIWLGSDDEGLLIYDILNDSVHHFDLSPHVQSKNIKSILVEENTTWVLAYGTDSSNDFIYGGLIKIVNKEVVDVFYNDQKIALSAMRKFKDTLYLASTNRGIRKFNTNENKDVGVAFESNVPPKINDFAIDDNGCIWIAALSVFGVACDRELQVYDSDIEFIKKLPANDLYSAFYDESNKMLWIGGIYGGASGINLTNVESVKYSFANKGSNSIASDNVYTLNTSPSGNLWIGYNGSGIDIIDRETLSVKNLKVTEDTSRANHVISIFHHSDGRAFVGTFGGGVWVKQANQEQFTPFIKESDEAYQKLVVTGFVEDGNTLWISSIRELFKVTTDGSIIATLPQSKIINSGLLFGIEEIDSSSLFLVTNAGAIILSKHDFSQKHIKDFAPGLTKCQGSILDAAKNSEGSIYFSADSLCSFNPNTVEVAEVITEAQFSDGHGLLLFGEKTIIETNGSIIIAELPDGPTTKIDSKVGHYFDSTVPHFGAIAIFQDYIVTGNTRGLLWTRFPQLQVEQLHQNPLFLENIKVMNKKVGGENLSTQRSITIAHDENLVIADFQKVDYFFGKTVFQAKMPSIIENPLPLKDLSSFAIPTGTEGKHGISIQALQNGLVTDSFDFEINVLPPWWRTTQAYLFYLIATILGIWMVVLLKQRKLKADNLKLEQTVAERTNALNTALKEKERLFENISHEFRTPLTIILGNIEAISNDNVEKTMNVLADQSTRLLRLVDHLLALAEIRAFKTEFEIVDVNRRANLIIESFKSLCDSKNLDLLLETDLQYSQVRIPKDSLELVMNNIVGNAIKYAIEETEIFVSLFSMDNRLSINVRNQSHPINTESAIKRYSHEQSENQASTGIGLDIVNELAQKLGGEFQMTQENGSVTCDFSMPIEVAAQTPEKMPVADATVATLQNTSIFGKVLVVEDNTELCNFLSEILSEQFEVIVLENGSVAFDYLQSTECLPDLIVSDVMMPLMDGFALCSKVKADRLLGSIPFILLTAKGDTQSQREGYAAKADDYIVKPFDKTNLLAKAVNLVETLQKVKAESINALYSSSLNSDDDFTLNFQSILSKEFSNPELAPSFVASALNTSTKTLNRRLSARFGKTFSEVLKCYRIEKSIEKIISGMAIKEVAFDCGFSSQSYFSQCFKQVMGTSPQDFINSKK